MYSIAYITTTEPIVPSQPLLRVVSFIASATEIVSALGRNDWLVGRSHECDFPPEVARLPALTAPKFKVEGTSAEIDAACSRSCATASRFRLDAVVGAGLC